MLPITNIAASQRQLLEPLPSETTFEDNFCQSLIELQEILQVYAELEDPLSNRLLDWGDKWLALYPENEDCSFEDLCARAGTLMQDIKQILANTLDLASLGKALVKQPLYDFENGWLWDEAEYRQYKLISPTKRCPFSQASSFQAFAHPLAKAMAEWVEKLESRGISSFFNESDVEEVDQVASEVNALANSQRGMKLGGFQPSQKIVSPSVAVGESKFLQLIAYNLLAKKAVEQRPWKNLQRGFAALADEKQAQVAPFAAAQEAESKRNREAELQRQAWLEKRLQELEGSYQDAVSILKADLLALQTQVAVEQTTTSQKIELLANLEAQMSTQMAQQAALEERQEQEAAARIALQGQLQQQLLQQTAENSAEKAALQERIARLNALHASKLARLEEVRRQQRHELSSELGAQIDTLRAEINTANSAAERQNMLIATLEEQVSRSASEYAALQKQCQRMQQETRTCLEAEMHRHLAQHTAQLQRLEAEMAQQRQQLHQRIEVMESSHRTAQSELKGQISRLNQQSADLSARVSALSASLTNETKLNQQLHLNQQQQQNTMRLFAQRLAAAKKKAKKSKKFLGINW